MSIFIEAARSENRALKKEQGHGQHNSVRKEGLRGRTSLLYDPQNDQEMEASQKRCILSAGSLVVVLVIEHLIHGVGTEHQESNVYVPTNLEVKAININCLSAGHQKR